MSRIYRIGLVGIALEFLLGLWVFFCPFFFGYQPQGAHWVSATRNDLWTGGLLALVTLVALLGVAIVSVRALLRTAAARPAPVTATPQA